MIVKHIKFTIGLVIFLSLSLAIAPSVYADDGKCNLDIYVRDQYDDELDADIYVDDIHKGYNDHLIVEVNEGTHEVEATKSGYNSDSDTVACSCSETKRVDLRLTRQSEEISIEVDDLDVDPQDICREEDEIITLSIPVTLTNGPDNTEVTAKFFVEENGGWEFIDERDEELDEDQTKTFVIDYYYNSDDLEEGSHDVRVEVTAEDVKITRYSDLYVEDCDGESRVNVGFIDMEPSDPDEGEIVQVKVSVTLEAWDSERVYVYAYIDDERFFTTSRIMYEDETERFTFTFDTDDYSTGSHNLKVTAKVGSESDSSSRSFTIGKTLARELDHCLSIDNIRTDEPLQPGQTVKILADVMSCGDADEEEIKARIEAFSKTYYTGFFDIYSGQIKEVFIPITIPDDVTGKQTIKVTVWNEETTDSWSKDFIVLIGEPFIEIKKEFTAEPCKTEKITFVVVNTGEVSDIFSLKVTGPVSEWITGVPEDVTLESDERKTITAYVNVPCDAELGYYEFTVTAEGSPKYSATSSINVVRLWAWPTLNLPTGDFLFTGIWTWLPWILILLFILLVLFLLAVIGNGMLNNRRRPMFECKNGCGC